MTATDFLQCRFICEKLGQMFDFESVHLPVIPTCLPQALVKKKTGCNSVCLAKIISAPAFKCNPEKKEREIPPTNYSPFPPPACSFFFPRLPDTDYHS